MTTIDKILIEVGVKLDYAALSKKAKRLGQTINKTLQGQEKQARYASTAFKDINTMIPQTTKRYQGLAARLKKNEIAFQGWAMSVMFFGMAIQRVFTGIWKQSTTVFNDIMHSVEGTVTTFDMLQGTLKYLWYTIGEALSPLAEKLIPIILLIQDWVENNEELAASYFEIGIKAGAFLFLVGTITLGLNGLWVAVAHVITILKFLFISNPITGLIVGIIAAISWLFIMGKRFGGFGELVKSIVRGVLRAVMYLLEGISWVFSKVGEGVIWVINKMTQGINFLIEQINKIPGINIGTIGKLEPGKFQFGEAFLNDYAEWETDSFLAPEVGYADKFAGTPNEENDFRTVKFSLDTSQTDAFLKGEEVDIAYNSTK